MKKSVGVRSKKVKEWANEMDRDYRRMITDEGKLIGGYPNHPIGALQEHVAGRRDLHTERRKDKEATRAAGGGHKRQKLPWDKKKRRLRWPWSKKSINGTTMVDRQMSDLEATYDRIADRVEKGIGVRSKRSKREDGRYYDLGRKVTRREGKLLSKDPDDYVAGRNMEDALSENRKLRGQRKRDKRDSRSEDGDRSAKLPWDNKSAMYEVYDRIADRVEKGTPEGRDAGRRYNRLRTSDALHGADRDKARRVDSRMNEIQYERRAAKQARRNYDGPKMQKLPWNNKSGDLYRITKVQDPHFDEIVDIGYRVLGY